MLKAKQQADIQRLTLLEAKFVEVKEKCRQERLKVSPLLAQYPKLRKLYLAEVKKEAELIKKIKELKEQKQQQAKR
ncbi:hypothetical protein PAMP_001269 [Pampus punctatissimus]